MHPSDNLAAQYDSPAMQRVSPRARIMWAVSGLITTFVLAAVGVWLWVGDVLDAPWPQIVLAVAAAQLIVGCAIVPTWRYRVHEWTTTAESVVTRRGWLTQERREAPLNRVQTVDTQRGPLEQLFGLTTVTITTASAHGDLKVNGLDKSDADRLVRELTARAAATDDDAT